MIALFGMEQYRCVEMTLEDIARVQRFFEANPEYHLAVNGEPPAPYEAQKEFELLPPATWPYQKRWLLAFLDPDDEMAGMADLIAGLFVAGVWHLGLFMVATRLYGSGTARSLYDALEAWMRGNGASWLRLGVVEGNRRAERFWEKLGYVEVRKRAGVEMGKRVNTLRVMAKPLRGGCFAEYLALVARDRPESA